MSRRYPYELFGLIPRTPIEKLRYHFEKCNDILALWGIMYLSQGKIPFPNWIQHHLASDATKVISLVNERHYKDVPTKIAKALGFDYGRCLTRWKVLNRNYRMFLRYEDLRLEGSDPPKALKQLANETNLEVWRVRRYLNRFAQQFTNNGFEYLVETRRELDLDLSPHSLVAEPGYKICPERPMFTGFEIDGIDIDRIDFLCRLKLNERARASGN